MVPCPNCGLEVDETFLQNDCTGNQSGECCPTCCPVVEHTDDTDYLGEDDEDVDFFEEDYEEEDC